MASPLQLNSSPTILGNDGNWTTYAVQVGSPPQTFYVLPSTVLSDTWIISPAVCQFQPVGNAQTNCQNFRGGVSTLSSSSTWEYLFNNSQLTYSLGIEEPYGWSQGDNGSFGHDTLILPAEKGTVPVLNSVIGSMNTNATATGLLGLASKNVSLTFNGQSSVTGSILEILRDAGTIPSVSYSYSAGGYYNRTTGVLILGGYDSSTYIPNNVPFTFAPDPDNVLSVGLLSISARSNDNTTLLSDSSVQALIDSTVSELWLPESWCDKFQTMFNLTFNSNNQLYTIDDDAIAANNKANPTVTITIANTQNSNGNTVAINFPWSAFSKTYTSLSNPGFTKPYFSLRRTTGPYTLGRVFLQEAVLTVDHERKTFSVSQVVDLRGKPQPNIVSITSPSSSNSGGGNSGGGNATSPADGSSSGGGISGGAIGGIVVAVLVVAAIIAGLFLWRRRRNNRHGQYSTAEDAHADTPGPQVLPPGTLNEKPAAAEMPTPRPGNSTDPLLDYHAQQRQNAKAAMAMSDGGTSELQGDIAHSERAQSPLPLYMPSDGPVSLNGAARVHDGPAELPAAARSELPSEHASPMSSPHMSPPISELAPSPGEEPLATASDMGWNTSPGEPQSPHSAESIAYSPVRGARLRDLRNNRTGYNPDVSASNRSSDPVPAMSATSGPLGLGIQDREAASESLRRQESTRSRNSDSTLVAGTNTLPPSSVSAALHSTQNAPRRS